MPKQEPSKASEMLGQWVEGGSGKLSELARMAQMRQLGEDLVNHPSHYTRGKIEVIEFIEDQKLPYHLGAVVKYVCRAGHKGGFVEELQDLAKAEWYLRRWRELRERQGKEEE